MDGSTDEFEGLPGSALRTKLEESLTENKTLKTQLAEANASAVIGRLGLTSVKPADLVGVAASELESKAKEVAATRAAEDLEAMKRVLRSQGVPEDQLDSKVQSFGKATGQTQGLDLSRMGVPPGTGMPEGLTGPDRLKWAMRQREN